MSRNGSPSRITFNNLHSPPSISNPAVRHRLGRSASSGSSMASLTSRASTSSVSSTSTAGTAHSKIFLSDLEHADSAILGAVAASQHPESSSSAKRNPLVRAVVAAENGVLHSIRRAISTLKLRPHTIVSVAPVVQPSFPPRALSQISTTPPRSSSLPPVLRRTRSFAVSRPVSEASSLVDGHFRPLAPPPTRRTLQKHRTGSSRKPVASNTPRGNPARVVENAHRRRLERVAADLDSTDEEPKDWIPSRTQAQRREATAPCGRNRPVLQPPASTSITSPTRAAVLLDDLLEQMGLSSAFSSDDEEIEDEDVTI